MHDLISRQMAINGKISVQRTNGLEIYSDEVVPVEFLKSLPSAQPELPSYVAEIEEEYQKAVKSPYIHKPLAKALYEVWKKHDREDAERRVTDGGLD